MDPAMQAPLRIAMVAGEASGDMLAALLIGGLQADWPGIELCGIGGPEMARCGFTPWWARERRGGGGGRREKKRWLAGGRRERLAVHGYSMQMLRRLRELLGIRRQLRRRLLAHRPALFIGIDAPDFNLGLEADLRAAGVKTVHFVCPSIWAWRAHRVGQIRRSADHVLCIFPFEPALLAQHGIAATYLRHPLLPVGPAPTGPAGNCPPLFGPPAGGVDCAPAAPRTSPATARSARGRRGAG